ncbi:MAG: hypothetical protein ACU0DJ_12495 [Paracoccus sp. (in: a-proteobacteria)]
MDPAKDETGQLIRTRCSRGHQAAPNATLAEEVAMDKKRQTSSAAAERMLI